MVISIFISAFPVGFSGRWDVMRVWGHGMESSFRGRASVKGKGLMFSYSDCTARFLQLFWAILNADHSMGCVLVEDAIACTDQTLRLLVVLFVESQS